jgi:hypothetical protein
MVLRGLSLALSWPEVQSILIGPHIPTSSAMINTVFQFSSPGWNMVKVPAGLRHPGIDIPGLR